MYFACPGLLPTLRSGATVVTPSHLLAQVVSHNFAEQSLRDGFESWRRPDVYDIRAWLKICWQHARFSGAGVPALLSGAQEHSLWRRIIKEELPGLFDIESTAILARRAAELIAEWHIPLEHEAWAEQEDAKQFRKWLAVFRKICREEGWISRSDLWRFVPKWVESGHYAG